MKNLEERAKWLRKETLDLSVKMGVGHLGGSYSIIEILVSLYDRVLNPRDTFILSKGHACYPYYILLKEKGYNPEISGHPDIDAKNGIPCTTGSLGHGFPIGIGMALALKIKKEVGNIYILMGDGECQEGTTWESSLVASHYKLDNLVAIIDRNNLQALDNTENILSLGDLSGKFREFGWHVSEINGHNFDEIISALKFRISEKSHIIVANTIKGKGISYMENDSRWHVRLPNQDELKQAYRELE